MSAILLVVAALAVCASPAQAQWQLGWVLDRVLTYYWFWGDLAAVSACSFSPPDWLGSAGAGGWSEASAPNRS